MNSPATARPPGRRRLALILAGLLALLGSFAVTAPAQAGYYYGSHPCYNRCGYGYSPNRYAPQRYYNGCSACGCRPRCNSGIVYERRYVEREYVERRYGRPCCHYRRHYGYNPYGYGGYQYRSRHFPWGYGGVRDWRAPYGYREPSGDRYGYRYEPSAAGYYEEPPRPPAPVWDETY
ncbi:hypothetical protein [Bradyrhizobium sp.]|uniref:hypothetical protein n=1 Tax=Bradyrhizobium sp. TaxID=376 RepID=UPI003C783D28